MVYLPNKKNVSMPTKNTLITYNGFNLPNYYNTKKKSDEGTWVAPWLPASSPLAKSSFTPVNIGASTALGSTKPFTEQVPDKIKGVDIVPSNNTGNSFFNKDFGKGAAMAAVNAGADIGAAFQDKPQYSASAAGNGFGMVDSFLANGNKSKVGTGMVNAGASLMNQGLSSGNGALALAGGIAGTVGTFINAGWGMKEDEAKHQAADANIAYNKSIGATAKSFDDLATAEAIKASDIYEGGWFVKDDAEEMNREIKEDMQKAYENANRNIALNVDNLREDQLDAAALNYFALGGSMGYGSPMESIMYNNGNMDAIGYGLMSDYLTMKNNQSLSKGTGASMFAGAPSSMFALGGDIQTHGADFTTGLRAVNAGGNHESNPYEGVQMGVAPDGTPNLVEEGETVFNDYVYSNRIEADDETKKRFHISKNRKITFADLSKKLEKESQERPNDPISRAALKSSLSDLAEQQERQKQEIQAKRAQEAFASLSPEEQVAVVQQLAQQQQAGEQQMAQEEAMQQQAMLDAQAQQMQGNGIPAEGTRQPMPEDLAANQQEMRDMQPQMSAYGGNLYAEGGNLYPNGGVLDLLRKLGYKTTAEAAKAGWKPEDFGAFAKWTDIDSNSKLKDNFAWDEAWNERITAPEYRAALSLGWNPMLGLKERRWYENPEVARVSWTDSAGKPYKSLNAETFEQFRQRYNTIADAVNAGLIKAPTGNGTIPMSEVAQAMASTKAWQDTDNWLRKSPQNMAEYLTNAANSGMKRDDGTLDTDFKNKWSKYGDFVVDKDNNWTFNLKDGYDKKGFQDYFWKSRTDGLIGNMYNSFQDPAMVSNKYVIDDKGEIIPLITDNLADYEQVGSPFTWGDPDENNFRNKAATFYKLKAKEEAKPAEEGTPEAENEKIEIKKRPEWLRYAGIFGPAAGIGMQALGIGKPDTSGLDAAIDLSRKSGSQATYKTIGNYLTYRPMDILFEQNKMDANSRATDNAIRNSANPFGTKMASMLANEYNNQLADADLYRKALEYNDAQRKMVGEFNKDTDKFNAQAFNQLSQFNASERNKNWNSNASLALQAAKEKLDADAGWYNGLYGNVSGLFKGISDIGRENFASNRVAEGVGDGVYGIFSDDTFTSGRYIDKSKDKKKKG